jgi:hypothetical protein
LTRCEWAAINWPYMCLFIFNRFFKFEYFLSVKSNQLACMLHHHHHLVLSHSYQVILFRIMCSSSSEKLACVSGIFYYSSILPFICLSITLGQLLWVSLSRSLIHFNKQITHKINWLAMREIWHRCPRTHTTRLFVCHAGFWWKPEMMRSTAAPSYCKHSKASEILLNGRANEKGAARRRLSSEESWLYTVIIKFQVISPFYHHKMCVRNLCVSVYMQKVY